MQESLDASPAYKLMKVDLLKEKVYITCKDEPLSIKEISAIIDINISKVKAYVTYLVKNNHLEKSKKKSPTSNQMVFIFKATEKVYKPRTEQELDVYFDEKRKVVSTPKKYLYDDLIASNPNLRKICLFDTKPTSDFLSGQKDKVNRNISSAWAMYDSF